ncbi:MAG: hypothetical protein K1X57_16055 [Gemmataceae bacterium]|nr:hypothetical protein [Gemmataceae bacterium]
MRRSRLWLRTLEDRIAPAVVSWDGDANDTLWASPTNWSGNVLPGPSDDVFINTSGFLINYTSGINTIKSLTLGKGSYLNMTGGNLAVTAGLDLSNEACTVDTANGAKFTASGTTKVGAGAFHAYSGSTITLSGLTSLTASTYTDTVFQANDAGSKVDLTALTSVTGSSATYFTRFRSYNGGQVLLPNVSKFDSTYVELLSQGTGAKTDVGSLNTFVSPVGTYSYLTVRNGGEVKVAPSLKVLDRVIYAFGENSTFPNSQLTAVKNYSLSVTDATVSFPNLTDITESSISVNGVGTVTFAALTNIPVHTNSSVFLDAFNGATLSLPSLTSVDASSNYTYFRAYSGATINIPSLTKIDSGSVELRATDPGSLLNVPALATLTFPGSSFGYVYSLNAGKIAVAPGLTKLNRSYLSVDTVAGFPVGQLTDVTDSNVDIYGGTITFTNLSKAGNGYLTTHNAGTVANFPALTSFATNNGYFSSLRSYSGSKLSAPAVTTIGGGYTELRAQDADSVLDLPGLTSISPGDGYYANVVAYYGGKIQLAPSFTKIDRMSMSFDTTGAIPAGQFTSANDSYLGADGGTTTFTKLATISNSNIQSNYAGTVVSYPALTSFQPNTSSFSYLRAYNGSTLSAPTLTKIDTGYIELRADGTGSVLNMPSFATLTFPSGTYGNIVAINSGTFNVSPTFKTMNNVAFTIDGPAAFPVAQLTTANDSTFYMTGGTLNFTNLVNVNRGNLTTYNSTDATFPALTNFTSNTSQFAYIRAYNTSTLSLPALSKIDTGYVEIRGQDAGATVNLPALTTVAPPAGTYGNISAIYGGKVQTGPGFTKLQSMYFFLDTATGFPTGNLTSAKDTNMDLQGGLPVFTNLATFDGGSINAYNAGTKATFPALTSFLANSSYVSYIRAYGDATISAPALTKIDSGYININVDATGAELNLPALTKIAAPVGAYANIYASGGTLKTAPSFEVYNTSVSFNDSTTFNWSNLLIDQLSYVGGYGKLPGNVTNSGTLVAGYYSGKTIEIGGNYVQTPTGALQMFLGGATTAGSDYSLYKVNGTASLNGKLSVYLFNSFAPTIGNSFTPITFTSGSGAFATYEGLDSTPNVTLLPAYSTSSFKLNAVAASGPIVTGFTPTGNVFTPVDYFDVTFNKAMNVGSFTTSKVSITGPGGSYSPTSIGYLGGDSFRVYLPSLTSLGKYDVKIGPDISDFTNTKMNQNGNGTNGEDPADAYFGSFTIVTADLVVQSIGTVPASANFGRTFSFDYTIRNDGTNPATGLWYDYVYLSTDATYDVGDAYIGYGQSTGLPLNPTATYTATATVTLPLNPARPDGNYYLIVVADGSHYVPEANEFNNGLSSPAIALRTPPRVVDIGVNGGAVQRSKVDAFSVSFNEIVTFSGTALSAFALDKVGGGSVTLAGATVDNTGGFTKVNFTIAPGTYFVNGSLVDGRYQVTALAGQITDSTGLALDGNDNGIVGDNYVNVSSGTYGVFRLFGDADGNTQVDANDFLQFRLSFLSANPVFDYDASGQVGSSDFLQFRLRFLQIV